MVSGPTDPDPEALAAAIADMVDAPRPVPPHPEVQLVFDHRASPWHSVCEVEAPEGPGLLADLATVFRAADVAVRSATIKSHDGSVYDTFELTTAEGGKLNAALAERVRAMVEHGVVLQHRRFRSPALVMAGAGAAV